MIHDDETTPAYQHFINHLAYPPSQDAIVANEGLGWDSPILNMFHVILVVTSQHPGMGGQPKLSNDFIGPGGIEDTSPAVQLLGSVASNQEIRSGDVI